MPVRTGPSRVASAVSLVDHSSGVKDGRGGLTAAALVLFAGAAGAWGVARGEVDGRGCGRIGFVRSISVWRFGHRDRGEEGSPDGLFISGVADGEGGALVVGAGP